ncbi:hypothetical protein ACO0KY_18675 [Undibacterium sp. Dicai25W]|uniref:hypothetical protein n=1 Tax=Undibacterium sp. Dicai25W TaxID=3413034 RepID=UPI003BF11F4B
MTTNRKREAWHLKSDDFDRKKRHAKQDWRFQMYFEYLRISPSYLLATQCENVDELAAKLGNAGDAALVWQIYCDFGNVFNSLYRRWWLKKGFYLFGVEAARPRVTTIAHLHGATPTNELAEKSCQSLQRYVSHNHVQQGRQDCLLVSIPVGLSKAAAFKQLRILLDAVPPKAPSMPKAPYEIEDNKLQFSRLKTGMRLAYMRSARPNDEVWRAAVRAKVSKVSHTKLDPNAPRKDPANADARRVMTIMASKLMRDTHLIAENAARGRFPCLSACPSIPFSYEKLGIKLKEVMANEKLLKQAEEQKLKKV